jgi:mono/diheme cytochrome c family protein
MMKPQSSLRAALIVLVAAGLFPLSLRAQDAARLYVELCGACHSIGGGDRAGPDLQSSASWPREELRATVKRMEESAGPMTDAQIDLLVELLKSSDAAARISAIENEAAQPAPTAPAGSPDTGRQLFFGQRRFAAGGSACFACHSFSGRGGTLAADLTDAHTRVGPNALRSAIERPGFPLMKADYGQRPITTEEATHLLAFLAAPTATAPSLPATGTEERTVRGAAGGLTLVVLLSLGFVAASRRTRRTTPRR